MSRLRYLAAAFNARPLGMPIPPNWFGVAAFGLLGAFVSPGFWLIGAGLEGLYLWALSASPRFRAVVDAGQPAPDAGRDWAARYAALLGGLDGAARAAQEGMEAQAAEIALLLQRVGAVDAQLGDVRQMAWLHLKLLSARASMLQVIASADRDGRDLEGQQRRLEERLAGADLDEDLRRSLDQQLAVIRSRRAAHADAGRRRELVEAEIERLRQQVSLVREQALLATDEHGVAASLDALSASLNEANRWLREQRELFAGLDDLVDEAPPPGLLGSRPAPPKRRKVSQ